jgi:hypothetical protein
MGRSRFEKALRQFKETEQPEAVLLVASHKEYVNIASAWMHLSVRRRRRLTKSVGESEEEKWGWLWDNVQFSDDTLRQESGVRLKRFQDRLDTLIANRMLYPDGSVNSFVRRYLREKVLKLLGVDAKTRRALKKAQDGVGASNL